MSSGLALRDLGGSQVSDLNEEDDDELERLIENGDLGEDDFPPIQNPCNGLKRPNVNISKGKGFGNQLPNAAYKMQGQFALCSSEQIGQNEAKIPLICEGLTEKNELPELNFTRS